MSPVYTDSDFTTYDNRWDEKQGCVKRLSSLSTALPISRAREFSSFSEYLLSWQLSGRHMFDMTGRFFKKKTKNPKKGFDNTEKENKIIISIMDPFQDFRTQKKGGGRKKNYKQSNAM